MQRFFQPFPAILEGRRSQKQIRRSRSRQVQKANQKQKQATMQTDRKINETVSPQVSHSRDRISANLCISKLDAQQQKPGNFRQVSVEDTQDKHREVYLINIANDLRQKKKVNLNVKTYTASPSINNKTFVYLNTNSNKSFSNNQSITQYRQKSQSIDNTNQPKRNQNNKIFVDHLRLKTSNSPQNNVKTPNSQNPHQSRSRLNTDSNDKSTTLTAFFSQQNKRSSVNSQKTRTNFFLSQEDQNFIPIDPKRVSHYINKNQTTHISKDEIKNQKWDKCLQHYMKARTRMEDHIRTVKNVKYQFDKLQLDKNNQIIKRRKILQLKNLSTREKQKQKQKRHSTQFVSNLIEASPSPPRSFRSPQNLHSSRIPPQSPSKPSKSQKLQNQMMSSLSNNGCLHRCDALLVNFVSTYFRRKFFKRTRKMPWVRRTRTDGALLAEMVGLEGKAIDQEVFEGIYRDGQQDGNGE